MSPAEGVRIAYTRRSETDYVFDFWTALGWSILTCGIYGFYVLYQLVRRSRDHHRRRLGAAPGRVRPRLGSVPARRVSPRSCARSSSAWARASRPCVSSPASSATPSCGSILDVVASGIVNIIAYILLDQDFVKHDYHEGAIETELSQIFTRLGTPISPPNPARLHQPHNYVGRVVVTLVTCGFYGLWWLYNMMTELNEHFVENWAWEDALAAAVRAE